MNSPSCNQILFQSPSTSFAQQIFQTRFVKRFITNWIITLCTFEAIQVIGLFLIDRMTRGNRSLTGMTSFGKFQDTVAAVRVAIFIIRFYIGKGNITFSTVETLGMIDTKIELNSLTCYHHIALAALLADLPCITISADNVAIILMKSIIYERLLT